MTPALLALLTVGLQNLQPILDLIAKVQARGTPDTPEEFAAVQAGYNAALAAALADIAASKVVK